MKKLVKFLFLLMLFLSCRRGEILDSKKDYELIKALNSAHSQRVDGIDVSALEIYASICEEKREMGKYCVANALIGYKLYFEQDFNKSMIHLKKSEANLEYCDSVASFVYCYISYNLSTIDTLLALEYINKAINKDIERNNLRRLPYSYLNKSCLMRGDSAKFYLQKSIELFDDWGDKMARCQYAYKHFEDMESDTIIAYMLPYYDSISFSGYASVLANAYLKKGEVDSALLYIDKMDNKKVLQAQLYFYNLRLFALKGEYIEACKWGEMAYTQLLEDCEFMINQRLSSINGEYDLLNVELQNEKERVKMMIIYCIVLLIMVVLLVVAVVIIIVYKRNVDNLKMDVIKRKERFNAIFEKYKSNFVLDKNSVFTEAMQNLEKLQDEYPALTRTDVAIVWLLFMNCSSGTICELLSISQNYYYQRRSFICKVLNISGKISNEVLDKIVRKYIVLEK